MNELLLVLGHFIFWGSAFRLIAPYFPSLFSGLPVISYYDPAFIIWIGALFGGLVLYNIGQRRLRVHKIVIRDSIFRFFLLPTIVLYYLRIPLFAAWISLPYIANLVGLDVAPIGVVELTSLLIAFTTLGGLGELAGFYGAFAMMDDAEEMRKKDPRPPIIYLRSFEQEIEKAKPDGRFSDIQFMKRASKLPRVPHDAIRNQLYFSFVMKSIGPYIAIERPDHMAMRLSIGAGIKSVAASDWKGEVLKWMRESAAIVFEVDCTNGLMWEMEQAVKFVEPTKILLILPETEIQYADFVCVARKIFPISFPPNVPDSYLMRFAQDWRPIPLKREVYLADSLDPFIKSLSARSQEVARDISLRLA